ncbi:MAG: glycosyltransferase family 1 protein [Acidobacteriota bacterium]|nr:glycosyltransferase family 1 protein [Acidobacteriota bacterium]
MRVLLIPDLNVEGWRSMALYADQLRRWLPRVAPDWDFVVARLPVPAWGRTPFFRFPARYLAFPWSVAQASRQREADLHHILDHSYAHVGRWLDRRRTIITVHDLYPWHLLSAGERSPRARARNVVLRWVLAALRESAYVIADSEFTKSELMQWLNYPEDRITVIPLGGDHVSARPMSESEAAELRDHLGIPRGARIVLHVGSCEERKNIPTLLRAFVRLRALVGEELHLVQVGGRFASAHWEMIRRWRIARCVRQFSNLPWETLAMVYQSAALLLFPSTYEGFGLPVLEAMRLGVPVVALAAGAVPEVLGDAGILVRDDDAEALAEAAARVLEDAQMREELVKKARDRARAFTWEQTARRVLDAYRALAESLET